MHSSDPSYVSSLSIIDAHIESLRSILTDAVNLANEASSNRGHDIQSAVGAILPIADLLSAAMAIHATILFLNRQRD